MTSLMVPGDRAPAQRRRAVPPATRRSGWPGTLRSEFTKIRSVRSTYLTLIVLFVASLAFGIIASAGNRSDAGQASFDPTATSLTGAVDLGELIIMVIGTLVITSEYGTHIISTSLTAMPRRGALYCGKAVVLTSVTLAVALITSFTSFFAGQAVLSSTHAGASITSPGALRAVILSALFVTCSALLAFGLGAIIRYTAGTIAALVTVTFFMPLLAQALPGSWYHEVVRWLPGGVAVEPIAAAKQLPGEPYLYGPYGQLAIFAGYAAIAVAAGALVLRRRDA